MNGITREKYGAIETNGIEDHAAYFAVKRDEVVILADPRLERITRLRLLTDPGFPLWDLSNCHGVLKDGTEVRVQLPDWQFSKRALKADLLAMSKRAGVYGKGLGIFDALSQVYP